MAKTDEGEFELILGNKQLISVFLVVVVLLGVFFSMGYIVGRNSASPAAEASKNAAKAVETPAPDSSEPQAAAPAADSQPAAASPADASTPQATHPEQAAAKEPEPAPANSTPIAPKPKPAAVGPAVAAKQETKAPASGPASVNREPGAGLYWQVVATSRPDAEIISEALIKKGFHSQVVPGPTAGIFRVLVGPSPDAATQAQTRSDLAAAGFKNPIMRKY